MADKAKEKTEGFVSKLIALVKEEFMTKEKFAEVKTKDGATIAYDGDMPMEGMQILVIPADGSEPIAPADGVLVFEDGTEVEVKGGVIVTVKLPADAPPAPEGEMGKPANISPTEAAAKKVIESTIKETVFSKQEVTDMLDKQKTEFEAQVKAVSDKFDAVKSENETLTKEIGKVSATNATLLVEVEKFKSFSTEKLPKLLEEFGATPQVQETEEEKKKKAEAFKTDKAPKMTDDEWRKKYMK